MDFYYMNAPLLHHAVTKCFPIKTRCLFCFRVMFIIWQASVMECAVVVRWPPSSWGTLLNCYSLEFDKMSPWRLRKKWLPKLVNSKHLWIRQLWRGSCAFAHSYRISIVSFVGIFCNMFRFSTFWTNKAFEHWAPEHSYFLFTSLITFCHWLFTSFLFILKHMH